MADITRVQGKAYLERCGQGCPACGGSTEGSGMNFEAGGIIQKVWCTNCRAEFQDVYKLAAICTMDGDTIASRAIPAEK